MCSPQRPVRATLSYKQVKELQEKLKDATQISYNELILCPRNRLPPHVDKLSLEVTNKGTFINWCLVLSQKYMKLLATRALRFNEASSTFFVEELKNKIDIITKSWVNLISWNIVCKKQLRADSLKWLLWI